MSWFAAILLPQFSLQAVLRLREECNATPIVVVEGNTEKGWVIEMTPAAEASGVHRGMASTQAMARCPGLRLWPRSTAQELAVNALLLDTAATLSPLIEATGDGLVLVDLRQKSACDWPVWAQSVVDRFAALHLRAQIGLAANPDLAALAAAHARPMLVVQQPEAFLSLVPLADAQIRPDLMAVLRDWGLASLGDLARLSRSEVTERLGPDADLLWERAAGRSWRELRLVRPPELYFEAFDFEQPIDTIEPLLFILRRQLDQLALRLRDAYRVATQMTLTLPLEGRGASFERAFTIPTPTGDPDVLFRILHTFLESLRLEQQPVGVRLHITPVIAKSQQYRLFETPLRDPNRFGETLARLTALVGEGRVGVVQVEDSHRPDGFQLVPPEFEKLTERQESADTSHRQLGLPLQRFRPPLAAQVRLHRFVPHYIFSENAHGEIIDASGPYRLSGSWWDRCAWSVEEWDIALGNGALYRISKHHDAWFVEGCYDGPLR